MSATMAPAPVNAFSVDVEDWFQVSAFERVVERSRWESLPCRVERNVERLLELLERRAARATFFTLGWIAERHPGVVRAIERAGHEVASHGYGHARVRELTPEAFREDVRRAKAILEDLAARPVLGYRAPSFSIGDATPWAFDILRAEGHVYSSSVYPIRHDLYGSPSAPRFAYLTPSGLLEIPPTSIRIGGRNFPASGGGFFRLLPYGLSRWGLRRVNAVDGEPAIFYCHPWEIDPEQPRVRDAGWRSSFRHYLNLGRTYPRLERLLGELRWDRMDRVFADRIAQVR